MKKFLFLLLSAAVAVSASAGISRTNIQKKISDHKAVATKYVKATRGTGIVAPTVPGQFFGWERQGKVMFKSDQAITWDFEDAAQFNDFNCVDNDGDGFNWYYHSNTGLTSGRMTAHSGDGLVCSESFHNNDDGTGGNALTPDNWLVSPEVTLGGVLSFWAMGQDASWCDEVFGVFVCVGTPDGVEDFVQVAGDFTATAEYVQYEVDLSAYQGQVGHFAIVHHNITDMFVLNIDDIVLDAGAVIVPAPVVPVVSVTPAATTADVAWGADENADGWNLRYRPFVDTSGNPIDCDFSLEDYQQDMEGWSIYDADGDGNYWGLAYSDDTQTDACLFSESWSYDTYSALTPDNYLFSPDIKLQGILRFTYWGASNTYVENFMVYAMVGDNLYPLADADYVTSTTHVTETIDLSQFGGEIGCIVFRHYNCSDQMAMYLDDIFIGDPDAVVVEPAEWIYVNELTDPNYTIDGLTPETEYEVQVMGYNEAHESDWSEVVNFWTLAGGPAILRGDVDQSGNVNIDDVTTLIDMLLNGGPYNDEADCDLSGSVGIDDVTTLIDFLLSGAWAD
ncbi:MAG: choice-of-anchor J domain-containing protein [Muribaculaceae bacterium]|nr:choice-of-anchor J domain-containing protein [Muribaculaceae bacterium]